MEAFSSGWFAQNLSINTTGYVLPVHQQLRIPDYVAEDHATLYPVELTAAQLARMTWLANGWTVEWSTDETYGRYETLPEYYEFVDEPLTFSHSANSFESTYDSTTETTAFPTSWTALAVDATVGDPGGTVSWSRDHWDSIGRKIHGDGKRYSATGTGGGAAPSESPSTTPVRLTTPGLDYDLQFSTQRTPTIGAIRLIPDLGAGYVRIQFPAFGFTYAPILQTPTGLRPFFTALIYTAAGGISATSYTPSDPRFPGVTATLADKFILKIGDDAVFTGPLFAHSVYGTINDASLTVTAL